ncbi:SMP-30/gluconolactonase/LRE family protein [Actinomadura sp. NPDC048394]|uniref:SMP-30/gluconolactonase/LRE family protein n=1 Tax=Actinomadura sp. NPDC048394 TaxID=3158223 RepID=UPI0033EB119F
MTERIEAIGDVRALVGESPVWDGGRLLWVDVPGGLVHRTDLGSGATETVDVGPPVSFAWPLDGGEPLVAQGTGLVRLRSRTVEHSVPGAPGERLNDGVVDAAGRIWIGTKAEPGRGALYRIEPGGVPEPVVTGVTISNGIRFSPDGSLLYYVDTPTGRVDVFDVRDGALSGRRVFAATGGEPDGLAVAPDGDVWVAMWGGSCLLAHAPDGRLRRRVPLPVSHPTSCAFADGRLVVTTASRPLGGAAGPLDGALLEVPL